jgi:hypothetical protein
MPAAVVALAIAVGYVAYLFRKVGSEFVEVAKQQASYLKDRFEIVDKSTQIFARTIEQQETEIKGLRSQLAELSSDIDNARNTAAERSIDELRSLSEAIAKVAKLQEAAAATASAPLSNRSVSHLQAGASQAFERDIKRLVRARELSKFPIEVVPMDEAPELVLELRNLGYDATIDELQVRGQFHSEGQGAILVGRNIPSAIAIAAIKVGRRHLPRLRYVRLSGDERFRVPASAHSLLFLGASSSSAREFGCQEWSDDDFAALDERMDDAAFRAEIRSHYRVG